MPEEEFIINVFCLIDDLFQQLFPNPLRARGYQPKLSDSEVITIEIAGEWLGHHKDKDIWKYFRRHWLHFFPNIPARTKLASQGANLWAVKQKITERPGGRPRIDCPTQQLLLRCSSSCIHAVVRLR